jgi:hypothetical protein
MAHRPGPQKAAKPLDSAAPGAGGVFYQLVLLTRCLWLASIRGHRRESKLDSLGVARNSREMKRATRFLIGAALISAGCAPNPSDPANSATGGTTSPGTGGAGTGGISGTTTGTGGSSAATGGTRAGSGGVSGMAGRGAGRGGAGTGGAVGGTAGRGPISALCPASALVCDDFEDGNLDGWTRVLTNGTMAIDNVHASSGTSALSINIPANLRGGFIERRGAPLFPLPNKTMWGRLMVYFSGVSAGHTDIVRGATTTGGTPQYNVGEQTGQILLNYYNGSAFDCWARPRPGKVIPLNTWMCWEWSFDGNANNMKFFIDGQLSREVAATGDGCLSGQASVWTAPDFGSLRIGAFIAEPQPTVMQLWIDDIAVGTQERIGCPAP